MLCMILLDPFAISEPPGHFLEHSRSCYSPMEIEQPAETNRGNYIIPKILTAGGCLLLIAVIIAKLTIQETSVYSENAVNGSSEHRVSSASLVPDNSLPQSKQGSSGQHNSQAKMTIQETSVYSENATNGSSEHRVSSASLVPDNSFPQSKHGSSGQHKSQENFTSSTDENGNNSSQVSQKNFREYYCPIQKNGAQRKLNLNSTFNTDIERILKFQLSFTNETIRQIKSNLKLKKKIILTLSPIDNSDFRKCHNSTLKIFDDLCEFTTDIKRFEEADAVIFRQNDKKTELLSKRNKPNQLWIYNIPFPGQTNSRSLPVVDISNVFNLTATYDLQSDLPMLPIYWFPTNKGPWNFIEKNIRDKNIKVVVYNKDANEKKLFLEKYSEVISELEDHNVTIEWYGECPGSEYNCQPDCFNSTSAQCFELISTKSKFALAFETSDTDYISERFFDPLKNSILPIVIGKSPKAKYKVLSRNIFIHYCDFESVGMLKKHLDNLNSYDNKFKNIFLPNEKGVFKSYHMWYCQVCGMLYRSIDKIKDPKRWKLSH